MSLRWTHVMFVDDTYLIYSTDNPQATLLTIEGVLQHNSSHWNTGLHITRGKLEGSKSKYFVLYLIFNLNGTPSLQVYDNTNNPVRQHLYGQPQDILQRI